MSRHARSLSDVTNASLSTLATFWVALFALVGAVELALDASVEMVGVRTPLMIAWLGAAVAAVATRALPERARTPALLGVVLALAAGTVLTREATGLVAPWIQITMTGGMATMAVGLLLPYQVVPYFVWRQSPWVRLRLEYNYHNGNLMPGVHRAIAQVIFAAGPHKHERY